MGLHHFSHVYKAQRGSTLPEILHIAKVLPRFAEMEEEESLTKTISLGELEVALKCFNREKCPCLDRWPMEFYSNFIKLIGPDLLLAIKDCRITGRMYEGFSSSFLELTPNVEKPLTFDDFRQISLCNCIHKIISKIISLRVKLILCRMISKEQFSFLDHY